eukprot:2036851-Rhodomonas_salina.1
MASRKEIPSSTVAVTGKGIPALVLPSKSNRLTLQPVTSTLLFLHAPCKVNMQVNTVLLHAKSTQCFCSEVRTRNAVACTEVAFAFAFAFAFAGVSRWCSLHPEARATFASK